MWGPFTVPRGPLVSESTYDQKNYFNDSHIRSFVAVGGDFILGGGRSLFDKCALQTVHVEFAKGIFHPILTLNSPDSEGLIVGSVQTTILLHTGD